jgi:iron complex outermembrane receptor protein
MKKHMKKLCRFLMQTSAFLFLSFGATAQTAVSGVITDSKDGKPVQGTTVTVKGTNLSTQSLADGSFKITGTFGANTLLFTSVGFENQEVPVSSTPITVRLAVAERNLNEVVVVAYGTRRKSDLTSALTSVSSKDFQKGAIASSEQLLQGKVAGLQITSSGGAAGAGSTIRIRGGASLNASNDPLIVIDGVPIDNNNLPGSANLLNTINPNDIESMSVLKDASATALYGSRASNGVIIVTTKKGSRGKIRFNFNTQFSLGAIPKTVEVLNGDQIRGDHQYRCGRNRSNTFKNLLGTANTDWQSLIYQSAFGYDNNLSASGALGNIPFRVSTGYLTQDGILKNGSFQSLYDFVELVAQIF